MLRFLYTCSYPGCDKGSSDAVVNVLVYSAADYYGIKSLKTLAKDKFQKAMTLKAAFDADSFSGVITQIYSTTPSSDRGLRDCAKVLMRAHKNSLRTNQAFRGLLRAGSLQGDFVLDMVDAWVP